MQACFECGDIIKNPRECLYCHAAMKYHDIVRESVKKARLETIRRGGVKTWKKKNA